MSDNWKIKLNITKNNTYNFFQIFQNFIASHTTPIQLLLHTSILFWPSSNSKIIRHLIIIPDLFFVFNTFIKSTHLFFIRCSLFISDTDPPFRLLIVAWNKLLILVTNIFLKGNTTTQAHIKPLQFLLTSKCWFFLWDIIPWRIKR